jgi:Fe-S-cluster containining protein
MAECIINGRRCTACCQAIHVPNSHLLQQAINGAPIGGDYDFLQKYWRQISAEEAERINPYPFQRDWFRRGADDGSVLFFECSWVTPDGCGCYENRPKVCRNYPTYLDINALNVTPDGEYAEGCPPWLEAKVMVRRDQIINESVQRKLDSAEARP